jgi:ParB family transcriptional regulator, chromosome partitioning protein
MTQRQILYVRALDCSKSPDNVRTSSDPAADAELEANIGETGEVIQNLVGLAIPRKKGKFEIFAGGRRLERVLANIEKGVLDEEFMVPVFPAKNRQEAISMSLAENYYNLRMNPADECRGFQAVIDGEKKTAADVAKRFGVTEKFVLGRLRLANLAPAVFEALRSGEITLDVAKAYGATADTDRQAKVFEQMAASYQRNNVNEIRRQLATGSFKGGDPKAMLIGRDAYLEAGGRVESDLFSDQANEVWVDGDIVERLVEQTLCAAAQAIRERDGFAEVRVMPATHMPWSETSQLREIEPEPVDMPEEVAARFTEIEAELAEIEQDAATQEDYTEEQSERIEALNAELEALAPSSSAFTPAQKAGAIAYVMIDPAGTPKLYEELYAVESADESDDELDSDEGDEDDGTLLDGEGDDEDEGQASTSYSARLRDELAMMKTELLALHIANDPQFALDLGTFIMADDANKGGWTGVPSELRARAPAARIHGYESDTPAARAWAELDEALDRSWVEHLTIEARYDAFCALDDAARAAWLGWAIARTMTAIPDGQTGSAFLNHLGGKLAIDVASWWRPTARNFFDRLTKPMILGLFEGVGGLELKNRYANSRKFDLAVSAEKLFAGEIIADAEVKARAIAWLPDPMRFGELAAPQADEDELETEAAVVALPGEADDSPGVTELPEAA